MIPRLISRLRTLSGQHRFGAVCVGITVVLALASALLLKYQFSLGSLHRKRQLEGDAVLATLRSASQLRQELALARETSARIDANLASDIDLGESIQYFYRIGDTTAAHIDDFHSLNVPTDNNPEYKRVPFALRASGTYPQIASFIYTIETAPRLANITYFALRRRPNTGLIALEMNLELLGKK